MFELTGREVVPMRLRNLVARGRKARLFAVFGPAGSGRSTLLGLYAQPLSGDPANHVVRVSGARCAGRNGALWRMLAEGLDDGPSRRLADAEALLESDPDRDAVGAYLDAMFDVLAERALECYCIIDDIHLLPAGTERLLVQELVDLAPAGVHVAVGGMENPGIALSRLRLRGEVVEVRPADLVLDERESRDVLRSVAPRVPAPAMDRACGLARGWTAGLNMLGLMLAGAVDAAACQDVFDEVGRGEGWIADFMHEEVVPALDEGALALAETAGMLGGFNARLVSAAIPALSFDAALEKLLVAGLVVPARAPEGSSAGAWYECHPLFAEALRRDLLRKTAPEEVQRRVDAAVDWLDANGCYEEALALATRFSCGERAFEVMTNHLFTVLSSAEGGNLSRLLEAVTLEGSGDEYLYSLLNAYAYAIRGLPKMVKRWLERASDAQVRGGFRDVRVERSANAIYQTAELSVLIADGDYSVALDKARGLAEQLGGPQLFLRATVLHKMGEALERLGRYREAREHINRAQMAASLSGRRIIELLCAYELLWLMFIEGELDAASGVALRVLASCTEGEKDRSWAVGLLHVALARLYLQWGDSANVREHVGRAEALLTVDSNDDAYVECWVTKARALAYEGDYESAYDLLLRCYEVARIESMLRGVDLLVFTSFADVLISLGRTERAAQVLDEADERMGECDYFYRLHVEVLRAWIESAGGNYPRAERRMRDALELAERTGVGLMASDCRIKLAGVLWEEGEHAEAEQLMVDALAECEREGRLYPFRNPLPGQVALLNAIAHARNENLVKGSARAQAARFAQEVLEACAGTAVPTRAGGGDAADDPAMQLSGREREIYELLKAGKTRREIAEELDIRVNTVRTHVRNIYKKLDIHDRTML